MVYDSASADGNNSPKHNNNDDDDDDDDNDDKNKISLSAAVRFSRGDSILEIIDHGFFSIQNELNLLQSSTQTRVQPPTQTKSQPPTSPSPSSSVADSSLSATELREKYRIMKTHTKIFDDTAIDLARSLLIENYYTIDTASGVATAFGGERNNETPHPLQTLKIEEDEIEDVAFDATDEKTAALEKSWVVDDFASYANEQEGANWYDGGGGEESKNKSKTGDGIQIFPQVSRVESANPTLLT